MFSHLFSKFLSNFFTYIRWLLMFGGCFAMIFRTNGSQQGCDAYSQRVSALHIQNFSKLFSIVWNGLLYRTLRWRVKRDPPNWRPRLKTHPCPPCLGREIIIGCLEFSRLILSFDDRLIFNVSSDEVQWMILWLPFYDRLMGSGW